MAKKVHQDILKSSHYNIALDKPRCLAELLIFCDTVILRHIQLHDNLWFKTSIEEKANFSGFDQTLIFEVGL